MSQFEQQCANAQFPAAQLFAVLQSNASAALNFEPLLTALGVQLLELEPTASLQMALQKVQLETFAGWYETHSELAAILAGSVCTSTLQEVQPDVACSVQLPNKAAPALEGLMQEQSPKVTYAHWHAFTITHKVPTQQCCTAQKLVVKVLACTCTAHSFWSQQHGTLTLLCSVSSSGSHTGASASFAKGPSQSQGVPFNNSPAPAAAIPLSFAQ
eukprot:10891-Heterococcus_DN1.PRE.1